MRPCRTATRTTVHATARTALAAAALLLAAAPLLAQERGDEEWCRGGWRDDDRATHCEVRELTLDARRQLRVDGRANGGVRVRAWDRGTILVRARVQATAGSRADAEAIAGAVRIAEGSVVRAEGPSLR